MNRLLTGIGVLAIVFAALSAWSWTSDDALRTRQQKVEESLEQQGSALERTEKRVADHDTKLVELSAALSAEQSRNDAQQTELEELLERSSADRAELDQLRGELGELSESSDAADQRVKDLETRIAEIDARTLGIAELERLLENLERERAEDRARLQLIEQVLNLEPTP